MTTATRILRLFPAAALAAALGCNRTDRIEAHSQAATSEYPDCQIVGSALVDHACFHAEFGPFGDGAQAYPLAASATPDFVAPAPNLNAVHTFYAVTLPGGSPGAHEGTVKYRPNRTGDWAILVTPDPAVPAPGAGMPAPPPPAPPRPVVPIRVLGPTGATVPVDLAHDVTGCSRLPRLHVVRLTAGTTYRIVVGPSPVAQVGFVLEKLSDFEGPVFRDADNDGFGNANELLSTACVPPSGYVIDDRDCDDARANVNPGASETCDMLDNDCDAQVDEGGVCEPVCMPAAEVCNGQDDDCDGQADEGLAPASCGVGACARTGTSCAPSSCTPGTPGAETCNQIDDDCDGGDEGGVCEPVCMPTAEVCNGQDDDCDGEVDEGGVCGPVCTPTAEVCNGADDDCDGQVDEGAGTAFYRDADGDGFGNPADSVVACAAPAGYVADRGDCNDGAVDINPQAEEVCDGADNDCSGTADDIEDPVAELSEHACEHAELGPFVSVTAGSGATAPAVNAPHTAYNIALPGSGGARGGEVRYLASEDGEYAFMVNPAVPFVVLGPDGQEVAVELELAISNCPALARLKLVDLAPGEYRLVFGPTDQAEVLLVVERGHHHHEEEGGAEPPAEGEEEEERRRDSSGTPTAMATGTPSNRWLPARLRPAMSRWAMTATTPARTCIPVPPRSATRWTTTATAWSTSWVSRPVCQQCSPIVLEARCGPDGFIAEASMSPPAQFQVPATLPLPSLPGGNHEASLSWRRGEHTWECRYREGGRRGDGWRLVGCTGQVGAGDRVEADAIRLKLSVSCRSGGSSVKVVLPNLACGGSQGC